MKTHEARLNQVFKRIGDVIDDQWALCAGMDELKQLQGAVEDRNRVTELIQTPIKSEPVSPDINGCQGRPQLASPLTMTKGFKVLDGVKADLSI